MSVLLLPRRAGGNLIHNAAGMLDKMITGSLEQMVIDDEIIGMV